MVGFASISNHSPIYLEIFGPLQKPKAPFKFNHVWLQDPAYIGLVTDFWAANLINRAESLAKGFCNNLSKLKHLSINWSREKLIRENSELVQIKYELSSLLDERSLGFIFVEDKSHFIELENQKAHILKENEESLRLRSRAIWLKAGDDNTRFFQNFAKGQKVSNTTWNLPLPEGGIVDSFNKISHLGSSHFLNLYKSPPGENLADIIIMVGHLPRFVNEEEVEELFALVTSRELESMLNGSRRIRVRVRMA